MRPQTWVKAVIIKSAVITRTSSGRPHWPGKSLFRGTCFPGNVCDRGKDFSANVGWPFKILVNWLIGSLQNGIKWNPFAWWMVVLTDFCGSVWREETTTRFSTTGEQLVSLSPARVTRPGAVGSSFLTLHHGNADALKGSKALPSLCLPTSPSEFVLVGLCCCYNKSKVVFELLKAPLLINLLFIFTLGSNTEQLWFYCVFTINSQFLAFIFTNEIVTGI